MQGFEVHRYISAFHGGNVFGFSKPSKTLEKNNSKSAARYLPYFFVNYNVEPKDMGKNAFMRHKTIYLTAVFGGYFVEIARKEKTLTITIEKMRIIW